MDKVENLTLSKFYPDFIQIFEKIWIKGHGRAFSRQQEMVRIALPHQSLHATRLSNGKLCHQKTARTDHLSGIS